MSGALWPVHPQIQPGEILSSWLVRIAQANGFKVHTFFAEHFGRHHEIWTRDVDHLAPGWLLQALVQQTGARPEAVAGTTLRSLAGGAFEELNEVGATRWVLPVGVYHRTRRSFGQQFCPICLATDPVPYLRLHWRLALAIVCAEHGVWLASCCPSCGRALAPHRADIRLGRGLQAKSSLRFCGYCHADLSTTRTDAHPADIQVQQHLDNVLLEGVAMVDGQPIYSHLYFDGLRMLMQGFRRLDRQTPAVRRVFELLPASVRMQLLRPAVEQVHDWPTGFIARCRGIRRPYSHFVRDREAQPWWVWSVLRREFYSAVAPINEQEAYAVLNAAQRWTGRRSEAQARWLFGRHVRSDDRPAAATEDEIDLVVAGLDNLISSSGPNARCLLLRDKVMLLVGRSRQLALGQLASMRLSDVDASPCAGPFWDNARSADGPGQLLAWYVAHVRPRIAPRSQSDALFLSAGGRALSTNAISARLALAVRSTGLRRSLAKWAVWSCCRSRKEIRRHPTPTVT